MPSPVEWGDDGTPRSPRFGDIYRPAGAGLAQARHVYLQGCGLPAAWAGQAQWRILETGFGLGLNFLAVWRAWRDDPQRPRMLHYASIEAWPVTAEDLLRSAGPAAELRELAADLARQWYGLAPGFHRLSFDDGRVLLTLCIGDVQEMLRQQSFEADSVFLDGFDPVANPAMWELPVLKGVARLCRRGAGIATWTVAGDVRRGLAQCGFVVEKVGGLPPKRQCLKGAYEPHWKPILDPRLGGDDGSAVVIGGGLAGAAAAASLARRGWKVQVLDAAAAPAAGASGLPAGLLAPHQSPDDNLLSRLSRSGVRLTLRQAETLLAPEDWAAGGVLEHRLDDARSPPRDDAWTRVATPDEKREAGLPEVAPAWWHERAAWLRPRALVRALLQQPGIEWRGHFAVRRVEHREDGWHVIGDAGEHPADLVVVAAATASASLLPRAVALHPVRGQVSWSHEVPEALRSTPVNGNGHFLPRVPLDGGLAWLSGSTYGRGDTERDERPADHEANFQRLRLLLPEAAAALQAQFDAGRVQAWTGVRCASSDRRPLVGPVAPGLWVSTAMGSRGLTFALLCGELLAARLHGEPLPLERRLAQAIGVERALSRS